MKTYGGMDECNHDFFISPLVGAEWADSLQGRFNLWERAIGWVARGWVGPRAGLDDMKKWIFLTLLRFELRPFGRQARNLSLYRLRYRGSLVCSGSLLECWKVPKTVQWYVNKLGSCHIISRGSPACVNGANRGMQPHWTDWTNPTLMLNKLLTQTKVKLYIVF
jgi:hypothetical protein